ncbi:MAG: hypothetical protein ABIP39_12220 [Polyangiaceae bacterium]
MNRTSLVVAVALTFLALACSSTSTSNTGDAAASGDCAGTKPDCISECGSDLGGTATCSNGAWVCEKSVDNATCACTHGYAGIACKDCDGKFVSGAPCNMATKTYECPPLACPADAGPDATDATDASGD